MPLGGWTGSSRGMTLTEVVVTAAVVGVASFAAIQGYTRFARSQSVTLKKTQEAQAISEVSLFLKVNIGGTKSIQTVSFRVPLSGNPGLSSAGGGVLVDSNKNLAGEASEGNDCLYFVARQQHPQELRLAAPISSVVPLSVSNSDQLPAAYFKAGEYFFVSSVQESDLFRLGADHVVGASVELVPDLVSDASPTYLDPITRLPPSFAGKYVVGDQVGKATISRLCLDSTNKRLVVRSLSGNSDVVVAPGIQRFSVSYNISACVAGGTTVATQPGVFERTNWGLIKDAPQCYKQLKAIRVAFETITATTGSFDFVVN